MATKNVSTRKIVKGVQVELKRDAYLNNASLNHDWTTVKSVKDGKALITAQRYNHHKGVYQSVQIKVPLTKLQPTTNVHVRLNNSYTARITPSGSIAVGCQRISAKQVLEVAAAIRKAQAAKRRAAK